MMEDGKKKEEGEKKRKRVKITKRNRKLEKFKTKTYIIEK